MLASSVNRFLLALVPALSWPVSSAAMLHQGPISKRSHAPHILPSDHKTHWIDIQFGTALSAQMRNLSREGYELSTGQPIQFDRWYRSQWQDLQLTFMTELDPQWGLLWGFGTGERGPKYRIDPSLQLGFLFQQPLSKHSAWSVRVTTRLGGRLREKTCLATYGIQGYEAPQAVNCRLAASELTPQETLKFLINEAPRDRFTLNVRYVHHF